MCCLADPDWAQQTIAVELATTSKALGWKSGLIRPVSPLNGWSHFLRFSEIFGTRRKFTLDFSASTWSISPEPICKSFPM